jgi:hypothetical protein
MARGTYRLKKNFTLSLDVNSYCRDGPTMLKGRTPRHFARMRGFYGQHWLPYEGLRSKYRHHGSADGEPRGSPHGPAVQPVPRLSKNVIQRSHSSTGQAPRYGSQ